MILNYLFIGAVFTLMIDWIINWKIDDPRIIAILDSWNNNTRIACILVWPLALIVFLITFFKKFFE